MFGKILKPLFFMFIISLILIACVPASFPTAASDPSNQVQSSNGDEAATPSSDIEEDQVNPSYGQTEPGDSSTPQGEQYTLTTYPETTYKFSLDYPDTFVVISQPAEKFVQLTPKPEALFHFMNPTTAQSDLGDLEPADLEIRVYSTQAPSVEDWLTTQGLISQDNVLQPYETPHISGVELCASTMIAPGCTYYVLGNGWIYQLTPATFEGEAMLNTFHLMP